MNIAFLPSADLSYESGSIINAITLISECEKAGEKIYALAQKPPDSERLVDENISINPMLLEHPIITDRHITDAEHSANFIIYLDYLFSLHNSKQLDVVLVQYFSVASYAAKVFSEMTGVPFIVLCYGRDLSSLTDLSSSLRKLLNISMNACNGIVFPNVEILKEFQNSAPGVSPPHLISPPALTPEIFEADTENLKNIPANKKIVTTINSCFKPEKGIETIISAFSTIKRELVDVLLLIAGTDDHPDSLNQKRISDCIALHGLEDDVIFTGYLNRHQIGGLLNTTDLFIDARAVSNFSSVLIEAQALNIPSISAKNISSLKIIEDGVNGLLFEPGDCNQLASLSLSLLNDPAFSSSLRAGCSEWCSANLADFESSNTTADIRNFIKGVISDGR